MTQNYPAPEIQHLLMKYGDIVSESDAGEILKAYNLIAKKQTFLRSLFEDVSRDQVCVTADDVYMVKEDASNIDRAEANFKTGITSILDGCRSGHSNVGFIGNFCADNMQFLYYNHPTGKYHLITEKLALYNKLRQKNVSYIGALHPTGLTYLTETEDMLVLYYHESYSKANPQEWTLLLEQFFGLVDQAALVLGGPTFLFIDCELFGQVGPKGAKVNEIVRYRNGEPIVNESEDGEDDEAIPLAKPTLTPEKGTKAKKSGNVAFPCPASTKSGRCPPGSYSWQCSECQQQLEYGFDDYFHCKCGRCPAAAYKFCCGHSRHREEYVGFPSEVLARLLDKIEPFKEINILILGETGVGKSTWINGFVNFVTYPTLDEALHAPVYLIPAHFSMMDEKYEMRKVSMGKSDNENETPGQSCTQMPKTYVFRKANSIIRLIDTPGIGDTRGTEQDKKNFQAIMNHLANYESVHGICILMKPNNARFTVMFRFLIRQLFTHLHREACQNIVFVFTNARSTFYKPGDTYLALQTLIEKSNEIRIKLERDTVYCVDNEAIRFMAALTAGITFADKEKENFKTSWETSVAETDRLLLYMSTRKPHMLRQTVSLNEVRRQIITFTEPLAHITKNIHTNIQAANDKTAEILHLQDSNQALRGRLFVPVMEFNENQLREVEKQTIDPSVLHILSQKNDNILAVHAVIEALQNRKNQLKYEMDEINKVASRFGYFLKVNAIIPYNDAMEEYLRYLIRAEEEKVAIGAGRKNLEDYHQTLRDYQEEKKLLEEAMLSGSQHQQITALDIDAAIKSLYQLPINGKMIKNQVETQSYAEGQQTHHSEPFYNPQKQNRKPQPNAPQRGWHLFADFFGSDTNQDPRSIPDNSLRRLTTYRRYKETQHSETVYNLENSKRKPQPNLPQRRRNLVADIFGSDINQDPRNNPNYSRSTHIVHRIYNPYENRNCSTGGPNTGSQSQKMSRGRSSPHVYPETSTYRRDHSTEPSHLANSGAEIHNAQQTLIRNDNYGNRPPGYNVNERSRLSNEPFFRHAPPSRNENLTVMETTAQAPFTGGQHRLPTYEEYTRHAIPERPPSSFAGYGFLAESPLSNGDLLNSFDSPKAPQHSARQSENREEFTERQLSPNSPYSGQYGHQSSPTSSRTLPSLPPGTPVRVAPALAPQPSPTPAGSADIVNRISLKPYEGKNNRREDQRDS